MKNRIEELEELKQENIILHKALNSRDFTIEKLNKKVETLNRMLIDLLMRRESK